jgi:hypothetical protein
LALGSFFMVLGRELTRFCVLRCSSASITSVSVLSPRSCQDHQTDPLENPLLAHSDLYLIHFPKFAVEGGGIAKVWAEFEALKEEGLAKSVS